MPATQQGQMALIADQQNRTVQLVPVTLHRMPRTPSSAQGMIEMQPDFDAPLADFDGYTP